MPEKKSCKRGLRMRSSPAVALNAHAASIHVPFVMSVPRTVKLCPVLAVSAVNVAPGLVANPATASIARPIVCSYTAPVRGREKLFGRDAENFVCALARNHLERRVARVPAADQCAH